MKIIPLTQGKVALVDDEDFERVSRFKWCAVKHKHTYYAQRRVSVPGGGRRIIYMHRFIIGVQDRFNVDHANHNGLDNRKSNIRSCTQRQNTYNRADKRNVTGFRGVNQCRKKFNAVIAIQDGRLTMGPFGAPEEAATAYDRAAVKFHGDFATLNFPENRARYIEEIQRELDYVIV